MTYFQKVTLGFLVVCMMATLNFWTLDKSIAAHYAYGCIGLLTLFLMSFFFSKR